MKKPYVVLHRTLISLYILEVNLSIINIATFTSNFTPLPTRGDSQFWMRVTHGA